MTRLYIIKRKSTQFKKAFAREFTSNGFNATRAYMKLRPKAQYNTSQVKSSRLLKDNIVIEEMDNILSRLTPDYVLKNIETIAKESKRDETRLASWVALGRYLSLWKDSPTTQTAVVNAIDLASLHKQMREEKAKQIELSDAKEESPLPKSNDGNEIAKSESDNIGYVNTEKKPEEGGGGAEPPSHPLI